MATNSFIITSMITNLYENVLNALHALLNSHKILMK